MSSLYGHNAPEALFLSPEDRANGELARQALGSLKKTFEHWMVIAKFLVRLRERADEIGGGRKTFQRLCAQEGFGDEAIAVIGGKAIVSKLEAIGRAHIEVEKWHEVLPANLRFKWASPSSIMRHCPYFQSEAPDGDGEKDEVADAVGAKKSRAEELEEELTAAQDEIERLKRNAGDAFTAKDRPEDVARVLFEMFSEHKLIGIMNELAGRLEHLEGLTEAAKKRIKRHVARPKKAHAPAG